MATNHVFEQRTEVLRNKIDQHPKADVLRQSLNVLHGDTPPVRFTKQLQFPDCVTSRLLVGRRDYFRVWAFLEKHNGSSRIVLRQEAGDGVWEGISWGKLGRLFHAAAPLWWSVECGDVVSFNTMILVCFLKACDTEEIPGWNHWEDDYVRMLEKLENTETFTSFRERALLRANSKLQQHSEGMATQSSSPGIKASQAQTGITALEQAHNEQRMPGQNQQYDRDGSQQSYSVRGTAQPEVYQQLKDLKQSMGGLIKVLSVFPAVNTRLVIQNVDEKAYSHRVRIGSAYSGSALIYGLLYRSQTASQYSKVVYVQFGEQHKPVLHGDQMIEWSEDQLCDLVRMPPFRYLDDGKSITACVEYLFMLGYDRGIVTENPNIDPTIERTLRGACVQVQGAIDRNHLTEEDLAILRDMINRLGFEKVMEEIRKIASET